MKRAKLLIKTVIVCVVSLSSVLASAKTALISTEIPYYGEQFYQSLGSGAKNEQLIAGIKKVLRSFHAAQAGGLDQILTDCGGRKSCYQHTAVGYDRARKFLLGKFYLVKDAANNYAVREIYCQATYGAEKFSRSKPGPDVIPDDKVVNVEHTWPQSRFNSKFNKDLQKSDMHHLFPSDSKVNSIRGSFEFGEVVTDKLETPCNSGARLGVPASGVGLVFEAPQVHKGNVARALFYFALRYELPIGAEQEAALRKWDKEDPIDEEELVRHEQIFRQQFDRNPFVDFPNLADSIADF